MSTSSIQTIPNCSNTLSIYSIRDGGSKTMESDCHHRYNRVVCPNAYEPTYMISELKEDVAEDKCLHMPV